LFHNFCLLAAALLTQVQLQHEADAQLASRMRNTHLHSDTQRSQTTHILSKPGLIPNSKNVCFSLG
jgi:hypothetical protein